MAARVVQLNQANQDIIWTVCKLRQAYKTHGIKLKKVIAKRPFRRVQTDQTLREDKARLLEMKNCVKKAQTRNSEIIQLDECIFNQKSYKQHAWAAPHSNITQTQHIVQQKCLAVVAAVSQQRGLIAFDTKQSSINSKTFVSFLEILRARSKPRKQLIVLLDNCSIHHSKAAIQKAQQLNIKLLFNVPYSPWFNGIELVWANAKQKFRTELIQQMTGLKEAEDFQVTVTRVLSSLNKESIAKCCQNALELILKSVVD